MAISYAGKHRYHRAQGWTIRLGGVMSGDDKQDEASPTDSVRQAKKAAVQGLRDQQSIQGILPFAPDDYFEQANPLLRSGIFGPKRIKERYDDFIDIFSLGGGAIRYRGPRLNTQHETVLLNLMQRARGRSLTKPVSFQTIEALNWLELKKAGKSYDKVNDIFKDLADGRIEIAHRPAQRRLISLLTSKELSKLPDAKFFREYIQNTFGEQLEMLIKAEANNEVAPIGMSFITRISESPHGRRRLINLDPIAALFLDGTNTSFLPVKIWQSSDYDYVDRRVLGYINTHRDGVFAHKLDKYHSLVSASYAYDAKGRSRFKSDMNKRLVRWEKELLIEPGASITLGAEDEWVLSGLKAGPELRYSTVEMPLPPPEADDAFDEDDDAEDDDAGQRQGELL